MIPEEITRIVKDVDDFVLITHVHPDGDALGSLLALTEILEGLGKNVFCYLEEPVSYIYNFLPGCTRAHTDLKELKKFIEKCGSNVASISLDCGDSDRMGKNKDFFLQNSPFIVFDHHKGHKKFGDYRWVRPGCSSTGEMVYELAMALGAEISYNSAFNLYVAISTDTGSFCYDATSPRTLRIAADLLEIGVRPDEIAHRLYANYTLQRLKLMELVLATLELYDQEQLAVIYVTKEMFDKSGAIAQDAEGFIDYPRALRSVKVAAFIKEGGSDIISVSLRAKGECDVAEIAKSLGGGGHRNASGFRFVGISLEQAKAQLLSKLREALKSEPGKRKEQCSCGSEN